MEMDNMYRETYEEFDNITKDNYKDYLGEDGLQEFLRYHNSDSWLKNIYDYELKNEERFEDFFNSLDKDKVKEILSFNCQKSDKVSDSVKFLNEITSNNSLLNVLRSSSDEVKDKFYKEFKNDYMEFIFEDFDTYSDDYDLEDDYWEEAIEDSKDEILQYIDEGNLKMNDPYAYNGVSPSDFFSG